MATANLWEYGSLRCFKSLEGLISMFWTLKLSFCLFFWFGLPFPKFGLIFCQSSGHPACKQYDGTAYFDRAISYVCKMFMKLSTGVSFIKTFFFVTDEVK
jgi:hypothetical protein